MMQIATETKLTAAEVFAQADAKRDQLRAKLEAASGDVQTAHQVIEKKRALYRSGLASNELDGTPAPSRADLESAERELAIAEDRLAGLEESVVAFQLEWKRAKADALFEQAAAIRAEAARRQARIHELQEEVRPRQTEIAEHSCWINTELLKTYLLETEARAL